MGLLQKRLPEFLVLGDYRPEARAGPAVWVRCMVDRTLDDPVLPDDRPPLVCLPGVARQQLRAGEQCPDALKPLVELQFRGVLWHQPNGNDWAVNAFLASSKALGLDIAHDRATAAALLRALPEVALYVGAAACGSSPHGRLLRSDAGRRRDPRSPALDRRSVRLPQTDECGRRGSVLQPLPG